MSAEPSFGSNTPGSATSLPASDPDLPSFTDASDRTTMNLAHKSAMIIEAFPDRIPNARELEDMTRAFGVDLVSMALKKILASVSPNKFFIERVDRVYRDIQIADRSARAARAAEASARAAEAASGVRGASHRVSDGRKRHASVNDTGTRGVTPTLDRRGLPLEERAELCIIESVDPLTPGASWGGHVETWRAWGRKAGLTTDVIQTEKKNSLLANAEIIRRELKLQPHDRRIIATVGQGSAEFRLLLEQLLKNAPEELAGIQMWINVSGLIRGGSGVNRNRGSWWSRKMMSLNHAMRGWPSSMAHQLSHTNPRLRLEPELQGLPFVCVSMVGFPQVGDVPGALKMSYLEMSRVAPNDGLAYFHESVLRPGYIVPVPGMSHRAESERLGPWFQAVLTAFAFDRDVVRPVAGVGLAAGILGETRADFGSNLPAGIDFDSEPGDFTGFSFRNPMQLPDKVASQSSKPRSNSTANSAPKPGSKLDAWKAAPLADQMPKDFDDEPPFTFGNDLDFE